MEVSNRLSLEHPGKRWGPGLAEGRVTAIAACRTCGTEPLENARFCHGCGSPVKDGDTRAEYKQVTVLFVDVVPAKPWPGLSARSSRCPSCSALSTWPCGCTVG